MPHKTSFAARALLALVLLFGFYALALGLAGLLVYIPYAEVVYGGRLHLKIAFLCLAGAFAILKGSVFVPSPRFTAPGPEITERDQPRLFALIREVAGQMDTNMPEHVYLVPEVNAFVTEIGGFMGFGTRRVMGIGVGLLAVDSVSELKATIAHEFGHYTGGDTRLGGLVYRTRAAIFGVLGSLGEGFLSKPFEWYGKLFLRVSHGVSRAQELSADRASVAIAGKQAHIRGLEREARASVLFERFVAHEVVAVFKAGYRPDNLYDGFHEYTSELERRGDLPNLDALLKDQETSPYDTHPALPERIAYAEALEAAPRVLDDAPSMSLLDRPDEVQAQVTEYLATQYTGQERALERVNWDQVSARIHVPKLAADATESLDSVVRSFGGESTPGAALRTLLARLDGQSVLEVAKQLEPRLADVPDEVAPMVAAFTVQRSMGLLLGATLVQRGGSWTSPLGSPHSVNVEHGTVEPFTLASEALDDPSRRPELLAMTQA